MFSRLYSTGWKSIRRSRLQTGDILKMDNKIYHLDRSSPIQGGRGVVLSGHQVGSDFSKISGGKGIDIPTRTGGSFMDCVFDVFRKN